MAKLHKYAVVGDSFFPLDMLRYDRCYPADPSSVDGITYMMGVGGIRGVKHKGSKVRIFLMSDKAPTVARWNSFDWAVEGF